MNALRSTVAGLVIACSIVAPAAADPVPSAAPSVPLDASHFVRAGDLATDVTLYWTERPSGFAGKEDDPGPSVATGKVAIVSGAERTDTLVSFATLRIAPPNIVQMIPLDAKTACGASGPIAILPLAESSAPAVVVTSVAIGKGCFPIQHLLLPLDDRARRYRTIAIYGYLPVLPTPTPGAEPAEIVHVRRTREIVLPALPGAAHAVDRRGSRIVIVDGYDAANRALTVAIAPGRLGGAYFQGKVLAVEGGANGFEGTAYALPPSPALRP
jgi:hypothetical protein